MPDTSVERIFRSGIIAIMRRTEASLAIETVEALVRGGIDIVEVTLNSPGADDMLRALSAHFGDRVLIGAGTVMSAESAKAAIAAGARFIVSPHTDRGVIEASRRAGLPVFPGGFTPTEIVHAWKLGATAVKVFPIGSVGARYLRDVLAPLTEIPLVPTGGITLDNAAEMIRFGARALGLGSDLVSAKTVTDRQFDTIAERARRFVEEVAKGRSE